MIKLIELDDASCLKTIEMNEFPSEILESAERVIIMLTQSWCPDWWAQKLVFKDIKDRDDLKIYFVEYDKKTFRTEFTAFKESVFKNGQIPYLRFYRNGTFEHASNYSGRRVINNWLNT